MKKIKFQRKVSREHNIIHPHKAKNKLAKPREIRKYINPLKVGGHAYDNSKQELAQ